ncbi:MAG: aquaporin [Nitrososphaerales archaeon]
MSCLNSRTDRSALPDSHDGGVTTTGEHEQRSLFAKCVSEAIGTALLVAVGLSIVIFDEGRGSHLAHVLPSEAERRALTGMLFGATGMTIALSPVGRISGAHINPGPLFRIRPCSSRF